MKKSIDSKQRFIRAMKLGVVANIFFIVFIVICFAYYFTLNHVNIIIEIFAYAVELTGFVLISFSTIDLIKSIKQSLFLKIAMPLYCIIEIVVMLLEVGFIKLPFWDSMSSVAIITHVVLSIFTVLAFLPLDINNKHLEITVVIISIIMLMGSLGYRVYISVLINTVAFIALYGILLFQFNHEQISIQFNGMTVEPKRYKSTFFD